MSLCDTCRNPGRCCSGFLLNGGAWPARAAHPLEVLAELATVNIRETIGLPFMPLYRRAADGAWLFWCPNLGRDGRCTVYENRPLMCREYEAGSDPLCAEHVPPQAS